MRAQPPSILGFAGDVPAIGFANNIALNSAYLAGVAGAAIGNRFITPDAVTVNKVYFLISSYTGTAANVNDLEVEIRADSAASPDTTGTIGGGTGAVNPASNTSWVSVSGLTAALSAATYYWAVVGDADGNAVDFATVRNRTSDPTFIASLLVHSRAMDTLTGWLTRNDRSAPSFVVVVFSDNTAIGIPWSAVASGTSSTTARGLLLGSLTEARKVYGYLGSLAVAGTMTGNIWSGSNGPSGTGDVATTSVALYAALGSPVNTAGVLYSGGVTLNAATQYRLTMKGSSACAIFNTLQIGTVGIGSVTDLTRAFPGNGAWYYTEESGGTWANDSTTTFPVIQILTDYDQPTGGGSASSGGSLVGPGNLIAA